MTPLWQPKMTNLFWSWKVVCRKAQDTEGARHIADNERIVLPSYPVWKTDENPHTQLDSYIKPGKFDTLVGAVKTLCAFKVQGGQQNVSTPSLALKIG